MAKPLAEPGTSSDAVLETQKLLNLVARASTVRESGEFDRATQEAIRTFQRESGLRPTGVLDQELLTTLQKTAKLGKPPKYQVTLGSRVYLLNEDDWAALIERVKKEFRKPMILLRGAVEEARMLYDDMKKLNDDQYIVSFFVNAYNRRSLPPEGLVKTAEAALAEAEKALNAGNFGNFGTVYRRAEKAADDARKELKSYCEGIIDGAGSIVTGLEFVQAASFTTVAILAAPVAASYGMGAVAAGVVAGAGTNAVESIAGEIGKGIAGSSQGFGKATFNVLKDSAIGGLVGAFTAGKGADKIIEKLGPMVAKQLAGQFFERASEKAVVRWIAAYFRANGAAILEGVMTDTLKAYKSNATGLTVDAFLKIVAKQVVTAGAFAKFAKLGDVSSKALLSRLPKKVVDDLIKSLGKNARPADLEPIFAKAIEEFGKEGGGKVYDAILDSLSGKETPEAVEKKLVDEFAMNKKLLQAVKDECEKQAKKRR
jgi:peptidoglycan hydrolase-like protein with peptidoglycan-binding domain